jgi:hypothetical protein
MLKYVIEKLDDAEESRRDLYIEKDGKFILNVDGIPDVEGLKKKANELLTEKKDEQTKRKALEAEIVELKKSKPSEKNDKKLDDIEAQLEDAKTKLAEKDTIIETIRQKEIKERVNSIARLEAGKLTKDTSRLELLSKEIEARLTVDGDSVTVLDENGKPTISQVDELSKSIATKFPFLVDGKGASGGGANGNDGGGGGATPLLSEISDQELNALRTSDPETYKRVIKENK